MNVNELSHNALVKQVRIAISAGLGIFWFDYSYVLIIMRNISREKSYLG